MKLPILTGKRFLPLLTVTKRFPYGVDSRAVYSLLVWVAKFGQGKSEVWLGAHLDPSIRVRLALDNLLFAGLVTANGGRFEAAEPTSDQSPWFVYQKDKKVWHGRFVYLKSYYPVKDSPLTYRQVVLYQTLASLSDDEGWTFGQTRKGLATLTGVGRTAVTEGLERLRSLGLIDYGESDDGRSLGVLVLPFKHPEWLADNVPFVHKTEKFSSFVGRVKAKQKEFDPDDDFIPDFAEVKSEKVVFPEAKESVTILKGEQTVNCEGRTDVYLERRRDQGVCAAGGGRADCDAGGARAAIERRLHCFGVELGLRGLFLERITTHPKASGLDWYLKKLTESHDREQFALSIHPYHRDRGMDDDKLLARIMGIDDPARNPPHSQ